MTYKKYESAGGEPAELYVFTHSNQTFRYTSADEEIVVASGALAGTYVPVTISRGAIQQNAEVTNNSVDISIDRTSALAQLFQGDKYLVGAMSVEIARLNRLDTPTPEVILQFSGEAAATATGEAGTLVLHCTSAQAVFEREIPSDLFQPLCNHFLFDAGCTLNRAAFRLTALVTEVSVRGTKLTVPDAATKPDDYFSFGYAQAPDGRPVAIIDHVGTEITLIRPFPEGTIQPGVTSVDFYPGCDRRYQTCLDKFNNVVNFLGFDTIPEDDPFTTAQS